MIQIKRGSAANWHDKKVILADGQPGYDKDRKKLKIGNGKDTWDKLPDASGMTRDAIFASEAEASKNKNSVLGKLLGSLGINDGPIITYGDKAPDKNTVGEVYLQYYDAEPEVDYVVESYLHGNWQCRKWHSGKAECYGVFSADTLVREAFEGVALYHCTGVSERAYPFKFTTPPCETATVHSTGGVIWLATEGKNSEEKSASYRLISPDKQLNTASHKIALRVEGFWR